MDYQVLLNYFSGRQENFISIMEDLTAACSFTGEKENITSFLKNIQNLFSEFSPIATSISTKAGPVLIMEFYPGFKDFLVLLAHADTVRSTDHLPRPQVIKNRMYANGCYDMKNGIALFYFTLLAIKELKLPLNKRLKIILTPDEESGSVHSLPIILGQCKGAQAVLLPEPCCPDGSVKTTRKSVSSFKAELSGIAAHSGIEPEAGRDANRAAGKLISRIDTIMTNYPDVTFNPGLISGGLNTNVISPSCKITGEFRSYSYRQLQQVINQAKKITDINGVKVCLNFDQEHPALEFNQKNKRLFSLATKIADSVGFDLKAGKSGGGSDGSDISAAGIAVIDGIGMQGGKAHSPGEYIELSDFPFRATLATGLCLEV